MEDADNNLDFPETKLNGRTLLSFNWLPEKNDSLLDAGCSYGNHTRFYTSKANNIYGVDISSQLIHIAESRYPEIHFICTPLENLPFEDGIFDAIVMTDVLEHTIDKITALNNVFRVLKNHGIIIITCPHKGLFCLFDPYNYGYYLRKYLPFLYRIIYKSFRFIKEGKLPHQLNPAHLEKHFHYSIGDFYKMLDLSDFKNCYKIKEIKRTGLFLEVFMMNLETLFSLIFKKKIREKILKPFRYLGAIDYKIDYGCLAYNIALKIEKAPSEDEA